MVKNSGINMYFEVEFLHDHVGMVIWHVRYVHCTVCTDSMILTLVVEHNQVVYVKWYIMTSKYVS